MFKLAPPALAALLVVTGANAATMTPSEAGVFSYLMGRCQAYTSPSLKQNWQAKFEDVKAQADNGLAEALAELYYKGIQDSRSEPLSLQQCRKLLEPKE